MSSIRFYHIFKHSFEFHYKNKSRSPDFSDWADPVAQLCTETELISFFYDRRNLAKANWIPSEQIVELQTPAVSTVTNWLTQLTHPVWASLPVLLWMTLQYVSESLRVILCRESFGRQWASLLKANSVSSLKKLSTWWSVWVLHTARDSLLISLLMSVCFW